MMMPRTCRYVDADPAKTMILPRLVVFVGGMATKVALHLIARIKREFGSLDGPYAIVIIDSAKELDASNLGSFKVRFIHVRPLSLAKLENLMPVPAFYLEHVANRGRYTGDGEPGSGSVPIKGAQYMIAHLPTVGDVISDTLGDLVHPRTAARAQEDTRFGGREVDLSRIHMDVFGGHGGSSTLVIFVIAEYARMWLQRQGRPFHISGRFLLASGHASLPEGIQPILGRNAGILASYLDAVQSGSPLLRRELALVNDERIIAKPGPLFEETLLYGQRPGERLGVDEYTKGIADAYFHELTGKAGTWIVSRELDFRNTRAEQSLNGRQTHHSAIGHHELTVVPTDVTRRLRPMLCQRLVQIEQQEAALPFDASAVCRDLIHQAGLDSHDVGASIPAPNVPSVHERTDVKAIEAAHARLEHESRAWQQMIQARLDQAFGGKNEETSSGQTAVSRLRAAIRETVTERPILQQIRVYKQLIAYCKTTGASLRQEAHDMQQRCAAAKARETALRGRPARTREWAQNLHDTWQEIRDTTLSPCRARWGTHLLKLAEALETRCRRLVEIHRALEQFASHVEPPRTDRRSLLSSANLVSAAQTHLHSAMGGLRRTLVQANGSKSIQESVHDSIWQISDGVEHVLLAQYRTVGDALILLADQGVSVVDLLRQQIEATEPMLTADQTLLTGWPLQETTVVVLPEGTRTALAAKGIDIDTLQSKVLEDNVSELVILRVLRGYAMPVIPEIREAVSYLFKAYRDSPNESAPWLHGRDAVPLPILPPDRELEAATLFARVLGAGGEDGVPKIRIDGGITYFCNGHGQVALGAEQDDLLEGLMAAIARGQIDPACVQQDIDRFYERRPELVEDQRLIQVAQEQLNKARGPDYVSVLKIHTAIDRYLRIWACRGQSRKQAFCTLEAGGRNAP